jgi:hypothetical protein
MLTELMPIITNFKVFVHKALENLKGYQGTLNALEEKSDAAAQTKHDLIVKLRDYEKNGLSWYTTGNADSYVISKLHSEPKDVLGNPDRLMVAWV